MFGINAHIFGLSGNIRKRCQSKTAIIQTRPRGYERFFMLNSTEHEFILLIYVKMPTIDEQENTTSESLKASHVFIFQHFNFHEQLKFHVQLS